MPTGRPLVSEGMTFRKGTFELEAPKDAKADAKYALEVQRRQAPIPTTIRRPGPSTYGRSTRYAAPLPVAVKQGKRRAWSSTPTIRKT